MDKICIASTVVTAAVTAIATKSTVTAVSPVIDVLWVTAGK